jgi:hypothetical protein
MAMLKHAWLRSSRCEASSCVEVLFAPEDDAVHVRDSKCDDGPTLRFSRQEWAGFVAFIKADMR